MILVTGCPRSGTKNYTAYLVSKGQRIQHERPGEDGTCDWRAAVRADSSEWSEVIHLVRHPLNCISSMTTLGPNSWRYLTSNVGLLGLPRDPVCTALAWLRWNDLVSPYATSRVRTEDIPICDANKRAHNFFQMEDFGLLALQVEARAKEYGY